MDLIYTDRENNDLGVLKDFYFDLAFGEDENDFELKMPLVAHCLDSGYTIYMDGTEYGGIVDGYKIDTKDQTVVYNGRTWHGVLDSKIITPESGEDYKVVSGDANLVLSGLISEYGLSDRFEVSEDASDITLPQTNLPRYKGIYSTMLSVLRDNGGKLSISIKNGIIGLDCVEIVDYSEYFEFTDDEIGFTIEKNFNPVNHLICLGQGELKDRQRIDLFADEDGNISTTQTIFGIDERTETYDYSSVESLDELEKEGISEFKERRKDGEVNIDFDVTRDFDVSDLVEVSEVITGLTVKKRISKKIVSINKSQVTVNYKIK